MTPYVAIVFANRNDEYTPDQKARILAFIDYYSYYDKKYPGLFEFVICDWNPPLDRQFLKDAYSWNRLSQVTHIIVPPDLHKKLCPDNSRPILDYTARNVCIRRAKAPFILVINQDIFLSSSILDFLACRKLSKSHFYRADRCDFMLNYAKPISWHQFDEYAIKHAIRKHIRPQSYLNAMSLEIKAESFDKIFTRRKFTEYKLDGIIYSDFYNYFRKFYNASYNLRRIFNRPNEVHYEKFRLHTNASGDFLLAPKKAFYDVHGFVETYQFYMHLDGYMCFQLFAAGYKQAIMAYPHTAFHSEHARSAREGRPESMTYAEHVKIFNKIFLEKTAYQMNPDSWGLRDYLNQEKFQANA